MTDATTFGAWMRDAGLDVQAGSQPGELRATTPNATGLVLRPRSADVWELVHERSTTRAAVRATWQAPADERDPVGVLADIIRRLALSHALVEAELTTAGDELRLRFSAPVHPEGLCKQAFLSTLSSLIKVVESHDLAAGARADDLAALVELQRQTDAYLRQQQDELARISQQTAPPPPPPAQRVSVQPSPPAPPQYTPAGGPPPPPPPAWPSSDGRR